MKFNIVFGSKPEEKEAIKFLNSKARDFYLNKHSFIGANFYSIFKGNLQVAMVDIERTIRGTFGCDIFLKNVDINLLKLMFPNATTSIFKVNNDSLFMGRILETLRNINSHARISERDLEFFESDFSHLNYQYKMHPDIVYFNKEITIAGVLYLICNFLRKESLENFIKSDFMISYIINGSYGKIDAIKFIDDVSKVNLEVPIRQKRCNDLFGSIVGEYDRFNTTSGEINIVIGTDKYPTTKIKGLLKEDELIILKGSLTRTFYSSDYKLSIKYIEGFVELSNLLPPFALVDYLYETHINLFDGDIYNELKKNWFFVSKLNYSKFYINKNINVLLLPKTVSDFTMLASVVADSLLKSLLLIEDYIYRKVIKTDMSSTHLTSIGRALKIIHVPSEIITEVKYLRNFVAHGYLLNECLVYNDEYKKFTVDFFLETLCDLMNYLKSYEDKCFEYTRKILNKFLIEKIIGSKYKKAIQLSIEILGTYPTYDKKELYIKNNFLKHSFIEIEKFNKINDVLDGSCKINEINIEGLEFPLYFKNNDAGISALNNFLFDNNLKIANEIDNGIYTKYYLVSNTK